MNQSLPSHWIEALSLSRRRAPELYLTASDVEPGPYADAILLALTELRLAAVFCIEGVPTIGFLNDPAATVEQVNNLHRVLWNQGLMSLLLVIRNDELVAYSLVKRPLVDTPKGTDPRLVVTLSLVRHALFLRELIESAESGRFWYEHETYFDPKSRVDSVLLDNLFYAYGELKDELGTDASQALLMQGMFIAYLEDRKIVREDVFRSVSGGKHANFKDILAATDVLALEKLFAWLKGAFNGNIFNAPCAFDIEERKPPRLKVAHLKVLASFRHGREEMKSGQLRFWGYHFQYMPIALISAVYDRFLKEEDGRSNTEGAFYTPMFLADMVVNQVWDELADDQRASGVFCDPACGSGIFLVRLFQRLVAHHCRTKKKRHATWNELKAIARRLHGGDINASAVRVAAFSLYIAMLEVSNPPDLAVLIENGKLLPSLYRDTLSPGDFFETPDTQRYDAVIGNPPWKGRAGLITSAHKWSAAHDRPDPAKDIAWAFVWKSLDVIKSDGLVGLLLPAMGVLHNTSATSHEARRQFINAARIRRIINLSDLCFQLFDGAQRPTAFVIYQRRCKNRAAYRFEYWTPKADLNLRLKRILTLARSDRSRLRSDQVIDDPAVFKRRLWTRAPDERLLQYLCVVPPLSAFIKQYKDVRRDAKAMAGWVIGQGFQPADPDRIGTRGYRTTTVPEITKAPYLDIGEYSALALRKITTPPWKTKTVRRAGFVDGFNGPHILIPQGVERAHPRVRASYSKQNLTFEDSIQAIIFPSNKRPTAKLLTAVLNSRLAAWFYFHETANLGTDRAKVHQEDLLKLPFAPPQDMPDPKQAAEAAAKMVRLIDKAIRQADNLLTAAASEHFTAIDALVYEYYGLTDQDIALIEDSFDFVLPAMQPRRSAGLQPLWANARAEDRSAYATMLCDALKPWFRRPVTASLAAKSADLAIVKLTLNGSHKPRAYTEQSPAEVEPLLREIGSRLHMTLPGNVQLVPDLRLVEGNAMYLVKPLQLRHWLRSVALADAEQIAADFSSAVARDREQHAGR